MRICVFGASSENIAESYKSSAYQLGEALAKAGHCLVFGGGNSGLMGAIARGFDAADGYIIGIAPELFDTGNILYKLCDEKIITTDMSSRKMKMMELADAFIALAGGIGTYDELFEVMVDRQLKYHDKPIIVYNVNGYYDQLLAMLDHTVEEGFMREGSGILYSVCQSSDEVIKCLEGKL